MRETIPFGGIPLTEGGAERLCGIWVLDIRAGETISSLRFDGFVQEIFDVQVLQGIRFPEVAELGSDLVARSFVLPSEALVETGPPDSCPPCA